MGHAEAWSVWTEWETEEIFILSHRNQQQHCKRFRADTATETWCYCKAFIERRGNQQLTKCPFQRSKTAEMRWFTVTAKGQDLSGEFHTQHLFKTLLLQGKAPYLTEISNIWTYGWPQWQKKKKKKVSSLSTLVKKQVNKAKSLSEAHWNMLKWLAKGTLTKIGKTKTVDNTNNDEQMNKSWKGLQPQDFAQTYVKYAQTKICEAIDIHKLFVWSTWIL